MNSLKKKTESWNHFTAKIMMGSWGFMELTASASLEKLSMSLLPLNNNCCELNLIKTGSFSMVKKYFPNHRRFQTRASLGIARVKFWSIVLIAYHYIVLQEDGAESSDSKDNRQSNGRWLGEGLDFSPPISLPRAPHVSPARVTWPL